jgi:hypothetical protein
VNETNSPGFGLAGFTTEASLGLVASNDIAPFDERWLGMVTRQTFDVEQLRISG